MKTLLILLGLVLLLAAGAVLLSRPASARALLPAKEGRAQPAPSEGPSIEEQGRAAIERARADVQEHGWHVVAVPGEGRPGFLFTIGLWETYKHPELLVFAASEDPRGFADNVNAVVQKIAAGEKLEAGKATAGAFGKFDAGVRKVLPKWYRSFLGTALGYYDSAEFPVLQLFWPDREGHYPWQSGFDESIFSFQPALFQSNGVLAGVGYEELRRLAEEGGDDLDAAAGDLFVDHEASGDDDLLSDWRWKVGPDSRIHRVTIFGDVVLQDPDGSFSFLDTGANEILELASKDEDWRQILYDLPGLALHGSLLLHLRDLGVEPGEGQVYDWIQEPMVGGSESTDNVQWMNLKVRLSHSGRLARSLETADGESADEGASEDDATIYAVVINEEEQYSMWPADKEIPDGWKAVGKTGTKQECLEYIEEVWVDMRPKSVREAEEKSEGP